MYGGAGVAAGAAAAGAQRIANAIRAAGVFVSVSPTDWLEVLVLQETPLVVRSERKGFFSGVTYQYLVSYKGFAFHTTTQEPMPLPPEAEIVDAQKIWVPG